MNQDKNHLVHRFFLNFRREEEFPIILRFPLEAWESSSKMGSTPFYLLLLVLPVHPCKEVKKKYWNEE